MIEIEGRFHDGETSRSRAATLRAYADGTVRISAGDLERSYAVGDLSVAARIADAARHIALPGGAQFETPDADGVDALLDAHGPQHHGWLHRLERSWPLVAAIAAAMLVLGTAFFAYGLPSLAKAAAFAVPPETSAWLAQGTLEVLDRSLADSELPEGRREALRAQLARAARAAPEGYAFELVVRGGGPLGANALALPSGTVVITDELVELAEADEELFAVLAHEVGHVLHRHGLRQAIQSSALALVVVLVTGDLSSTSAAVAAFPTILAEAKFSRAFEREADDHALEILAREGIDPGHFARMLRRLQADRGGNEELLSFLSTHPTTEERIRRVAEGGRD